MNANTIAGIFVYIGFLFLVYGMGCLVARLWRPLQIFILITFVYGVIKHLDFSNGTMVIIYNIMYFIIPLYCLIYPTIKNTFGLNSFNPFRFIQNIYEDYMFNRYQKQKVRARNREQQEEENQRRHQENLNEEYRRASERARQQRQERERAERERQEQEARRTQTASEKLQEAYSILGVSPDMSMAEIKKAYYEKYKQCDPSRINDMNEELVKHANEMAKKLNWAIEVIKQKR